MTWYFRIFFQPAGAAGAPLAAQITVLNDSNVTAKQMKHVLKGIDENSVIENDVSLPEINLIAGTSELESQSSVERTITENYTPQSNLVIPGTTHTSISTLKERKVEAYQHDSDTNQQPNSDDLHINKDMES